MSAISSQPRVREAKAKCGWLMKQGHNVKNWKRRFFRVKDVELHYFAKEKDHSPKGIISLVQCQISEMLDPLTGILVKDVQNDKVYLIKCKSEAERQGWIDAMMVIRDGPVVNCAYIEAVLAGDIEKIRKLAKQRAFDPRCVTIDDHRTALHLLACNQPNQELLEFLVKKCDVNAQDARGWTPLSLAIRYQREEMVRTLLQCGAKPVTGDTLGNSLLIAVDMQDLHSLRVMRCKGTDLDRGNREGNTALQLAAENGYVPILRYLLEAGADPNGTDGDGECALLLCARQLIGAGRQNQDLAERCRACMLLLVDAGADIDLASKEGTSVRQLLKVGKYADFVKYLSEKSRSTS